MINGSKVIICDKSPNDAANDYAWQTDPELAHLTATLPPTTDFDDYLSKYDKQLRYRQPGKHNFAIKTQDGKHIGNCTCYSLNTTKGEAEIGIVIGDRHYWDRGYGSDAISRLVDYIFNRSRVLRIHLKTLDSNKRAQRCFSKCGFKACGQVVIDGNNYILMELYCSHCQQNNNAK